MALPVARLQAKPYWLAKMPAHEYTTLTRRFHILALPSHLRSRQPFKAKPVAGARYSSFFPLLASSSETTSGMALYFFIVRI